MVLTLTPNGGAYWRKAKRKRFTTCAINTEPLGDSPRFSTHRGENRGLSPGGSIFWLTHYWFSFTSIGVYSRF